MLEDSPEGFASRWARYAAEVELFPRTEGSPLLECKAGSAMLQLFERTGPYLSRPGARRVIIHPLADAVERLAVGAEPALVANGISSLQAQGTVLAVEGEFVVLDAGVPLVVGLRGGLPDGLAVGESVRCDCPAPVHGFVVSAGAVPRGEAKRERHEDQI